MGLSQQIGASSLIKPGVIDNTAARPASPYEGQVIFQKDTDQLLVWNGTAWVIPNSPAQNPTGLEYISTTTFSGATNALFQSCFTSAYTNYRATFSVTSGAANACYLRFFVGATAQTGNIISQLGGITFATNAFGASNRSDSYGLAPTVFPTYPVNYHMDIFGPQVVGYTSYNTNNYMVAISATESSLAFSGGRNIATTQIDGFEITCAGGTNIAGTMTLYGYRKS